MSIQNHLTGILDRARLMVARGNQLISLANETDRQLKESILSQAQQNSLSTQFENIETADDNNSDSYTDIDDAANAIETVLGI